MDDFDSILKQLKDDLTKEQKSKKEPDEFNQALKAIKQAHKKPKTKQRINGGGYEYVPDPTTGNMRVRSQVEWEKYHPGRKVEEHQCVIFRNGNKRDFSKENLVLAYKHGTPLDALTCGHCGHRGIWKIEEQ